MGGHFLVVGSFLPLRAKIRLHSHDDGGGSAWLRAGEPTPPGERRVGPQNGGRGLGDGDKGSGFGTNLVRQVLLQSHWPSGSLELLGWRVPTSKWSWGAFCIQGEAAPCGGERSRRRAPCCPGEDATDEV